jgi:hypothetical protein
VEPLQPGQITAAFVNCSRRQAGAIASPPGLAALDWDNLDFLGWRDPRAPQRAYLVAPHADRTVGLVLRGSSAPRAGSGLCSLCHAVRPGNEVELLVARKAGAAGRRDNTVGTYVCDDLACSRYARGLRPLSLPQAEQPGPERVMRLRQRVAAFLDRVLAGVEAPV